LVRDFLKGEKGLSMLVLGLETSCDETSAAIVRDDGTILSNVVLSQLEEHRPYGGVVPEIAARSHLDHLDGVVRQAFREAGIGFSDLDGIAATGGPGLIGGVMVGVTAGKTMALARNLDFVAVNHLEAHALTVRLSDPAAFPYLLLLVSGGHCQLLAVRGVGDYRLYGSTMDDALGEAFDKTAKLLGLGYPGGPALERAAASGDPARFDLPRPMLGRPGCDFSFAGLKTAVRQTLDRLDRVTERDVADIAAAFHESAAAVLRDRCRRAVERFWDEEDMDGPVTLVVAGGVAANKRLRAELTNLAETEDLRFVAPPIALCTDNAAMVAWAGIEHLRLGRKDALDFAPRPRWPLDPAARTRKGKLAVLPDQGRQGGGE
jgi:N6-L-threonylcarbamoyladenine synthase